MESLYETRKQTFKTGIVYCIRTRTKTVVGEVIDLMGGTTLRLKNVRHVDMGYDMHPLEIYCVPYEMIVQYKPIVREDPVGKSLREIE